MNDRKMKFERVKEMPLIKREIISYLFDFVCRKRHGVWWHYKGEFKYDGREYELEASVMFDNQMFTYKNLLIEYKQKIIEIGVDTYDQDLQRGMFH